MGFKKRPMTEAEFISASAGESRVQNEIVALKKEAVHVINVRIPEELWNQFNMYIETKATRRESKNQVLLDALEAHLKSRMK